MLLGSSVEMLTHVGVCLTTVHYRKKEENKTVLFYTFNMLYFGNSTVCLTIENV